VRKRRYLDSPTNNGAYAPTPYKARAQVGALFARRAIPPVVNPFLEICAATFDLRREKAN